MTNKLYDENSFLKEFEATVIDSYPKADGFFTILDRTAFFPEGGGQASDTGYINDAKVYDVQIDGEIIYHYTTKQFKKNEKVNCKIDFERRFDFMQQHTGEHIISGIANKMYGCENVGFHLGEDIVTLDFQIILSKEQLEELELLANRAVYENRVVTAYYPDIKTLKTLEYRSKKQIEGDLRIVEIDGVDRCACCAPHTKTTGQVGLIKFISTEKLRGGIRIEIKCGNRALKDYNEKLYNVSQISSMLCVKQNETATACKRLISQVDELKYKLTDAKRSLLNYKIKEFKPQSDKTAVFEEELSVKDLQNFSDLLHKEYGGIRGAFSKKEDGFAFAITGEDNVLLPFFSEFKQRFIVKGGGRNTMVQGTVLATIEEIEEFFK